MSGHHPEQHTVSPDLHDPPDAWHDHSHDPMPQHAHGEVANANLIIGVGVGLFFAVVFTVIIIYWFYVGYTTRLLNENEMYGLEQDQLLRKQATATEMQGYQWAKQGGEPVKDTVQVPLDVAVRKVITEYATKK